MADVYMYADETGDLDMSGTPGSSRYFGFGTAVFRENHGGEIWEGLQLLCDLERRGVRVPKGMHAKDDSNATREEVFDLIKRQAPRFDTTFLLKSKAYPQVRQAGQTRLYHLAWYLHFKEICKRVSRPGDRLYVVAATLGTHRRATEARIALEDVCQQSSGDREIILCVWDAQSAWGIQVADYGLWATQRVLEGRSCKWYESCVSPTLATEFTPWGRA